MTRIAEILAETLQDIEFRALDHINRGQDTDPIVKKQADSLVKLRIIERTPVADGTRFTLTRLGTRVLFERLTHTTTSKHRSAA